MNYLVTGGNGFCGYQVVEYIARHTPNRVVVWDTATSPRRLDRLQSALADLEKAVRVLPVDISKPIPRDVTAVTGDPDYIIHMGANAHVDLSIRDSEPFVRTNVLGTMRVLDYAVEKEVDGFLYFSTDQVFGPAYPGQHFLDDDRHNPSNPYAATKSAGEQLAVSYATTHELPLTVAHPTNVVGCRQQPTNFIPLVLRKILAGECVSIHADPRCKLAGERCYLPGRNVASALVHLLEDGYRGRYNITGERFVDNLTLARMLSSMANKPLKCELVDFHTSRPGHDMRYAMSGDKLLKTGWRPEVTLDDALLDVVQWTLANPEWLEV